MKNGHSAALWLSERERRDTTTSRNWMNDHYFDIISMGSSYRRRPIECRRPSGPAECWFCLVVRFVVVGEHY
jgi:hypothetical protein